MEKQKRENNTFFVEAFFHVQINLLRAPDSKKKKNEQQTDRARRRIFAFHRVNTVRFVLL